MQYTFGGYSLNTERQELHRHGSTVLLQPKMYQVLVYLIEHRDRVVSKTELFEHAWAEIYVGDAALTQCIAALRKVLGDDHKSQGMIRTHHRHGYRFVAPVQVDAASAVSPLAPSTISPSPPPASETESLPSPPPATAIEPLALASPGPSRSSATAPLTTVAERRQLTVLCCTLSDVDTLMAQSDPEVLYDLMQSWRAACMARIARFDGHVAQQMPEGVVAYFGYPQAHEDDAQRAIRTGLELVKSLQHPASAVAEVGLSMRVGIHTGMVIAEGLGDPVTPGVVAVGVTPLIASHLCALARAPSVLISEPTARLVAGYFTLKPLAPQLLPGQSEPLPVYEVRGASGLQSRLDVGAVSGLTPFVSREAELALLHDRWRQVQEGLGQVVLVRGEAGIGKSRLVHEWKEEFANLPHVWLECRCSPYHSNTAFYPLVDLLQRVLGWQAGDDEALKRAHLEELLGLYDLNLDEAMALLANLLSLRLPQGQEAPLGLSPQQQRQRILEVLVHLVAEQASVHPVVFLVEDVHWVDPSTLDFLHLLIAQTSLLRLLVVMTCRPTFAWPLDQQTVVMPLVLTRLTVSQTAQMITQVAGGKSLPAEVLAQLVSKADGVPLYAEELTRMVLESGQLRETAHHYELHNRLAALTIPSTLQDSLMARLDRLGVGKEVAQWGAVLGREFRHDVLAAVTSFDSERLHASLQPLLAADLLQQRGMGSQAAYRFRNALLQEAAYAAILQRQRQQMHARIARVLEAQFAALVAEQPELVAYHHREAGHLEQAVPYWHQAGRLASERLAYVEAVSHLTQGLTLLATLREQSDDPEHLRQEVAIHIALGPALVAIKGFGSSEVEQTYTRARALCQRLGNVPELFSILGGLWRCYMGRQDLRPVRGLADEILRLAEASSDRSLLVEAYRVQGMSRLFLGDLDAARGFLEQCAALYDPAQHQDHMARYGGSASGVAALACLSTTLWLLGYPQQAEARSAQALTLAQALDHPFSLAFALTFAMTLSFHLRQPQATHALAERLIALASEHQFPYWLASGVLRRGWALVAQGQVAEGMAQLQQRWDTVEKTRLGSYHVVMADAYAHAGQPAEGLAVLHDVLAAMDEQSKAYWTPEVYRLQGDLLLQQTPPDVQQAETCWQQALAIARHKQARSLELRAAIRLARLWQRQGKPVAARTLLSPIYNAFTEGFDTLDLQEARFLLDALP